MNDSMSLTKETVLWRLAAGTEFESNNGQVFRKTGGTTIGRVLGRQTKLHESNAYVLPTPSHLVRSPAVSSHMSGLDCGCLDPKQFSLRAN